MHTITYKTLKGANSLKNYICLLSIVVLWCIVMPTVINTKDGQAYLESADGSLSSDDATVSTGYTPIFLRVHDGEAVKEIELEEYTARCLSALMDKSYGKEALKAQAVAIRSVVCYRHENTVHEGFELCSDESHCLPLTKVARDDCVEAVLETRGLCLTFEGKAALALSHLSSCISTESYYSVYGESLPYLQSVAVEDESGFACFKTEKHISKEVYEQAFSGYDTDFVNKPHFESPCFTEGNRVYTVEAGGLCFKGSTFARLFGLPSTCFSVEETESGFTIHCYGNGNGLGMSRISASILSKSGKDYKEILSHFYVGTEISHIFTE